MDSTRTPIITQPVAVDEFVNNSESEEFADQAVRLSDLFAQVLIKTMSKQLIAELTQNTVSVPQLQAMRYLALHDRVTVGGLADGLDTSYPSASNMVSRLEKQGYVGRLAGVEDRREVEIRLTPAGQELASTVETERIQRIASVLSSMPEYERHTLMRGLHRFVSLAIQNDPDVAHDICLRCGARASSDCPIAQKHTLHICR